MNCIYWYFGPDSIKKTARHGGSSKQDQMPYAICQSTWLFEMLKELFFCKNMDLSQPDGPPQPKIKKTRHPPPNAMYILLFRLLQLSTFGEFQITSSMITPLLMFHHIYGQSQDKFCFGQFWKSNIDPPPPPHPPYWLGQNPIFAKDFFGRRSQTDKCITWFVHIN